MRDLQQLFLTQLKAPVLSADTANEVCNCHNHYYFNIIGYKKPCVHCNLTLQVEFSHQKLQKKTKVYSAKTSEEEKIKY